MDCEFGRNCEVVLGGKHVSTIKHASKRGVYLSVFTALDGVDWEVLHRGKRVPVSADGVLGVRPCPPTEFYNL